jgi:hypothetical protein
MKCMDEDNNNSDGGTNIKLGMSDYG